MHVHVSVDAILFAAAGRAAEVHPAVRAVVGDTLSRWTFRDFDGRIIREYKSDMLQDWIWEEDEFYGDGVLLGGETQEWQYAAAKSTAARGIIIWTTSAASAS